MDPSHPMVYRNGAMDRFRPRLDCTRVSCHLTTSYHTLYSQALSILGFSSGTKLADVSCIEMHQHFIQKMQQARFTHSNLSKHNLSEARSLFLTF